MPFKLSKLSPGGDKWDKQAHLDHLHLFIADEFVAEEIADQFNAGKTTRRVHVDHVVCVDDREMWSDLMVYGAALVPRLDGCDPPVVLGRLGQGLRARRARVRAVDARRPDRRRPGDRRAVPRALRRRRCRRAVSCSTSSRSCWTATTTSRGEGGEKHDIRTHPHRRGSGRPRDSGERAARARRGSQSPSRTAIRRTP